MAAFEIIALDTVTPQLRAPGSGDTYIARRAVDVQIDDAVTNAVTTTLTLTHTSSGTVANGFGVGLSFTLENTTYSANIDMAAMEVISTNQGAISGALELKTKSDNVMQSRLRLDPAGQARMMFEDAATNSVTSVAALRHTTTGTTAAGFGVGLMFQLENSTYSSIADMARVDAVTTNEGNIDGALVLNISDGNVMTEKVRVAVAGLHTPAGATNMTKGFIYVPAAAGTPTGTPVAVSGCAPLYVDTTANKLYFYSGGQWRDAGP